MTPDQLAALFSPELNLSTEARTLIAHVGTLGDAEIPYARLMRLLQVRDEKKLRQAIAEAEDAGWIDVDRQTGRGHNPRFRYTAGNSGTLYEYPAEKNGTLSDTPPKNGRVNADRVPKNGRVNRPSSSTPSTPSTSTGAREDDLNLVRLRKLLDPLDAPLDQLMRSTGTTAWASQILGWYAPPGHEGNGGGTQWRDLSALPVDRAMSALSTAIGDYASNGEGWHPRRFRGYLRTAVSEELRKANSPDGAPKARASPHGAPPDWQDYGEGTTEFRGLNG